VALRSPITLSARALPLTAEARLDRCDGRHVASYRIDIPYFGWLWRPWIARRARAIEAAADAGRPLPEDVPWWAPPVAQDSRATAAVAYICLLSGLWSYGGGTGGLLTQTLPYAADIYRVGDAALGTGLAVVRIGAVLALALGLLADRAGRRRFILVAAVAHCFLAAAIGLAPSFAVYIGAHLLLRCLDIALGIALGVLAVEAVPAGNRAVTLSLVLLANGVGLAAAVAVLPIAAAGRAGFAAVYLAQLFALPFVLRAGRRLVESRRYLAHAGERHRYRELLRAPYHRRLVLVGGSALLGAAFWVPATEFFNRYLDDVHGFSAFELVAFLAITGIPSFLMLLLGGQLADRRGRKVIGVPLVAAATLAYAGFYLTDPPWIWALAFAGNMLGSAGGAALAPYRAELFPTRVRSAAGTVIIAAAVVGSVIGLASAGQLAGSLGIGAAIAALAVLPLLATVIVLIWFPETARRELEDTSADTIPARVPL
jgi:predicted MFS family arabinose efflux permease